MSLQRRKPPFGIILSMIPLECSQSMVKITSSSTAKKTKFISPLWFTNVSVSSASNSMDQLLNSGNLVLTQSNRHQSHGKVLIILPIPCFFLQHLDVWIGKLVNRFLTSWKSLNDLGTSDFTSVYFYYHIIK